MVYRQYLNACPELRERLLQAEANAKSRRIGFWNQDNPVLPADFRRGERAVTTPKPAATGVRSRSSSPPAHDYDCTDFKTQAEAQRILNSTPGKDPYILDSDKDRTACESLP